MELLQDKRLWIVIAAVVAVLIGVRAAGWLGGGAPQSDAPAQQEMTTQPQSDAPAQQETTTQ